MLVNGAIAAGTVLLTHTSLPLTRFVYFLLSRKAIVDKALIILLLCCLGIAFLIGWGLDRLGINGAAS